jgi:5-carboxymethyl-2-hydroxymuconate isomerase
MPQVILEFSANVIEINNLSDLFLYCHEILASRLPTAIATCKSRAIKSDIYCIGDGDPRNAFVHLTLKVLPGRSDDTLRKIGESIMEKLTGHFSESLSKLNLQITLEILELKKNYFKVVSQQS